MRLSLISALRWDAILGHGICINDVCVCDAPWETRHDFLHLAASGVSDCITHKTARYWVILYAIIDLTAQK